MQKGRSKDLIDKRNAKLCQRYYFWTEVKRLRFDDTLKILSEDEFFIEIETIMSIIRNAKKDNNVRPVPKVRMPRLTYNQLSLFTDEAGFPVSQIHRDSKT
ncbi:MAG: hypothetical protein LBT24_03610 [Tannerella sp.]|jgi:hypothetical protein|nr:hypothetical protein [Tannerella sp.]